MKKIVLALLLIANSLFAVTIAEINNANPVYARAYTVDVINYDTAGVYKVTDNGVQYPYWTASYPYNGLKYSGEINTWYYTFDFNNYYSYSSYWDQFNFSVHRVYVNLNGYSSQNIRFSYTLAGQVHKLNEFNAPLPLTYVGNGIWYFDHTNSAGVTSYIVETFIQASDGTAILGNTVTLSAH